MVGIDQDPWLLLTDWPVSDERRAARIFTCALTAPALPVRPKHMLSAQLEGRDGDPEID
jgi:hypothetical protein